MLQVFDNQYNTGTGPAGQTWEEGWGEPLQVLAVPSQEQMLWRDPQEGGEAGGHWRTRSISFKKSWEKYFNNEQSLPEAGQLCNSPVHLPS